MHPDRGDDQLTEPQCLKAWLRDVGGLAETFKRSVLNRKTGEFEERQHVWVFTGIGRSNADETRNSRSTALKNVNKDYTTAQLQEAANRVFSFVTCQQGVFLWIWNLDC